nr:unnamed protein product [Callosobruchus analis]
MLFDERPIYQRSAIVYLTRFLNENLKILLPAVAYYCTLDTELNLRARQKGRRLTNPKSGKDMIDESSYLLKPNVMPHIRQKLYQVLL